MEKRLQDQVAIITGSSSGIGIGVAKALATEGAKVVINYSREKSREEGEAVVGAIQAAGGEAIAVQCDVSKEAEVQQMFATTVKTYGCLDILVNNAGIQKDAPFVDMTLDDWNKVIGVNLTGLFLCAREAIRQFLKQDFNTNKSVAAGKIICMSSVHEVIPWAGHANYATSKGGIMLLMKTLAQEYAAKKIRVNSICPGAIQTRINKEVWTDPEDEKNLLKLIPYGRIGEPEDIGKVAAWLASDQSDYINGASIFVDGGMTLYPGFKSNG